ncbi:MAG: Tm-1-like ATP-binding domain-containing protein [Bacillota bacterium]
MKTVAIIISIDTKEAEARFLKKFIEDNGAKALVIDISARGNYNFVPDVTREEVCLAGGRKYEEMAGKAKNEVVQAMLEGARVLVPELYESGRFDGIISAGGLQNTMIAANVMQLLPLGVPKVIVSTVACGERRFEPFVGIKDIVMIPAIADIAGLNAVTELILSNAAAAVIGMLKTSRPLKPDGRLRIGTTLMGVTNASAVQAAEILKEDGLEVVCFHSTGVGGRYFEYLIEEGIINAAMDLSLHEITSGSVFGLGFSNGAPNRLLISCSKNIPIVVAPGALDFIDVYVKDLYGGVLGDYRKRKYNLHNNEVAHVKVFADEAKKAADIVVERLNKSIGPVTVLLPLRGLRADSQPGQKLHDPEVDGVIVETLRKGLKPQIKKVEVDANLNDVEFSRTAAQEMKLLLKEFYNWKEDGGSVF